MSTTQADLLPVYSWLLDTTKIKPTAAIEALKIRDRILRNLSAYRNIELKTGIPFWFVASLHYMECDLDFAQHLANGDPIDEATTNEPKGIPAGTWESCAIASLRIKGWLAKDLDWANPLKCLWRAEMWNGWGYRLYHPSTLSPFLWSGTNHYISGKYISDGSWSDTAVSKQIGIVPIWMALGIIHPISQQHVSVSDVSNLGGAMTIRPNYLVDVAANYKKLEHQTKALEWLQTQIPEGILDKFQDEFSPQQVEPENPVYQVKFKFTPRQSSQLLTGTLEFILNGEVYNTVTAISSLPGRQYPGSWNRKGGLIPPSSMAKSGYTVKVDPIYMPNVSGVSGNFYPIAPFSLQTDGALRGDWGVHFDAGVPGSLGCICATTDKGWAAVQREFKKMASLGIRSIELIVEYS
jgi:lysozyme family protein